MAAREGSTAGVPTLAAMAIVAMLLGGCASCPWGKWEKTGESKPAVVLTPSKSTDPQALQQVMAEVQRLGTMDPAAQRNSWPT